MVARVVPRTHAQDSGLLRRKLLSRGRVPSGFQTKFRRDKFIVNLASGCKFSSSRTSRMVQEKRTETVWQKQGVRYVTLFERSKFASPSPPGLSSTAITRCPHSFALCSPKESLFPLLFATLNQLQIQKVFNPPRKRDAILHIILKAHC